MNQNIVEIYKIIISDKKMNQKNLISLINSLKEEEIKEIEKLLKTTKIEEFLNEKLDDDERLKDKINKKYKIKDEIINSLNNTQKILFYSYYLILEDKNKKISREKNKGNINQKIRNLVEMQNRVLFNKLKELNININFELNKNIINVENYRKYQEFYLNFIKIINTYLNKYNKYLKNKTKESKINKKEEEKIHENFKKEINLLFKKYFNEEKIEINLENFINSVYIYNENKEERINKKFIEKIDEKIEEIKNLENNSIKDFSELNKEVEKLKKSIEEVKIEVFLDIYKKKLKEIIEEKVFKKQKNKIYNQEIIKELEEILNEQNIQYKENLIYKFQLYINEIFSLKIEDFLKENEKEINNKSLEKGINYILENNHLLSLTDTIKTILEIIKKEFNIKNENILSQIETSINIKLRKNLTKEIIFYLIDKSNISSENKIKIITEINNFIEKNQVFDTYAKIKIQSILEKTLKQKKENKINISKKEKNLLSKINEYGNMLNSKDRKNYEEILKEIKENLIKIDYTFSKTEEELLEIISKKYNINIYNDKNYKIVENLKKVISEYKEKEDKIITNFSIVESEKKNLLEEIKKEFEEKIKETLSNNNITSSLLLKKEILIEEAKRTNSFNIKKYIEISIEELLLSKVNSLYSAVYFQYLSEDNKILTKNEQKEKLKLLLKKEIKNIYYSEEFKNEIKKEIFNIFKTLKPLINKSAFIAIYHNKEIADNSFTEKEMYNLIVERIANLYINNEELSNLINETVKTPFEMLIEKDNLNDINKKVNNSILKTKLKKDKKNEIKFNKELENLIVKTLFLKGKNKKLTKYEQKIVKLLKEEIIEKFDFKEDINYKNILKIIKIYIEQNETKIKKIISEEKNKKETENIYEEIKNNVLYYSFNNLRLNSTISFFENINKKIEDLNSSKKIKNKLWEKENIKELTTLLENNEEIILKFCNENKLFELILNKENLNKLLKIKNKNNEISKEDFRKILKYLKNKEVNDDIKVNILNEILNSKNIEKFLRKLKKIKNNREYFFEDEALLINKMKNLLNNYILDNLDDLIKEEEKEENLKKIVTLKKIIEDKNPFEVSNLEEEYKKNKINNLFSSTSGGQLLYGEIINYKDYSKYINQILKKNINNTHQIYKSNTNYLNIFLYLTIKRNKKLEKFLKDNDKINKEKIKELKELTLKSINIEYNEDNKYIQKILREDIENLNYSEEEIKNFKTVFFHFLKENINLEINNLKNKKILNEEIYNISVNNIISNIQKALIGEKQKYFIFNENKIFINENLKKIMNNINIENLKKHVKYTLKNSINLNPEYNTIKIKGIDANKLKKELLKKQKKEIWDKENVTINDKVLYFENLIKFNLTKEKENLSIDFIKKFNKDSFINEENKLSKLSEIGNNYITEYIKNYMNNFQDFELTDEEKKEIKEKLIKNTSYIINLKNELFKYIKENIYSKYEDKTNILYKILNEYYETNKLINMTQNEFDIVFNKKMEKLNKEYANYGIFFKELNSLFNKKDYNIKDIKEEKEKKLKEKIRSVLNKNLYSFLKNSLSNYSFENVNIENIKINNINELTEEIFKSINTENLFSNVDSNLNVTKLIFDLDIEIKDKEKNKIKNFEIPIKLSKIQFINEILKELKKEISLKNLNHYIIKETLIEELELYKKISEEKEEIYKNYEKSLRGIKINKNNENFFKIYNKNIKDILRIKENDNFEYIKNIINNIEKLKKELSNENLDYEKEILLKQKLEDQEKKLEEKLKLLKKENINIYKIINDNIKFLGSTEEFQKFIEKELSGDNKILILKSLIYNNANYYINKDLDKIVNYNSINIDLLNTFFKYEKIKETNELKKGEEEQKINFLARKISNYKNIIYNSISISNFLIEKDNLIKLKKKNISEEEKLNIYKNIINSSGLEIFKSLNKSNSIEILKSEFKKILTNNEKLIEVKNNFQINFINELLNKEENSEEYNNTIENTILKLETYNKFLEIESNLQFLNLINKNNEFNKEIEFIKKTFFNKLFNQFFKNGNLTKEQMLELNEIKEKIFKLKDKYLTKIRQQNYNLTIEEIILKEINKKNKKEEKLNQEKILKNFNNILEIKETIIKDKVNVKNIFEKELNYLFNNLEIRNKVHYDNIFDKKNTFYNQIFKKENLNKIKKIMNDLGIDLNKNTKLEVLIKKIKNKNLSKQFLIKLITEIPEIINLEKQKTYNELINILNESIGLNITPDLDIDNKNIYVGKEGLILVDPLSGISENERKKENYLKITENKLVNNINIIQWGKAFFEEENNNSLYKKMNSIINEEDPETEWYLDPQNTNFENKYKETNILYLLENEKRANLKLKKINQILKELKNEKIEMEFINDKGEPVKELVNVFEFLNIDNFHNNENFKEGLKKFKNSIINRFEKIQFDEEIKKIVEEELKNEGLILNEENNYIYWQEFSRKYKEKIKIKIETLIEKEKNGEDISEEMKKLEKNIQKVDNEFLQLDKFYLLYEKYHKIIQEKTKLEEVLKKLELTTSNPTILAIIEYNLLPKLKKENYPPEMIRNVEKKLKEKKLSINNILKYNKQNMRILKNMDNYKNLILNEINYLENKYNNENISDIAKEKIKNSIEEYSLLLSEIETIIYKSNVLDNEEIKKINKKLEIFIKTAEMVNTYQKGRLIVKEITNKTNELTIKASNKIKEVGEVLGLPLGSVVEGFSWIASKEHKNQNPTTNSNYFSTKNTNSSFNKEQNEHSLNYGF